MKPKLKRFLWNTLAIACGLFAMMVFAGEMLVDIGKLHHDDATIAHSETLVTMDGLKLKTLLHPEGDGRPALMFLYASWCPYCKQQFGILEALQKEYPKEKLQIIHVSIEQSPYDLSKFLLQNRLEQSFTPYFVTQKAKESFLSALQAKGADFNGGVPYLLFFDVNGNYVKGFPGLTDMPRLQAIVRPLLQ